MEGGAEALPHKCVSLDFLASDTQVYTEEQGAQS